jgi:hypothetical protein
MGQETGQRSDAADADGLSATRRNLRSALGTMVPASAAPYGYTITIWSSGAVLSRSHGLPTVGQVFAYAAGALAAYGVVSLIARGPVLRMESHEGARDRVVGGALNWFAVGGAVGSVALVAKLPVWIAWPLGSFAATSIYILVASLQLALVARRRERGRGG